MREVARVVALLAAAAVLGHGYLVSGGDSRLAVTAAVAGFVVCVALVLWSEGALTVATAGLAGHYVVGLVIGDGDVDPVAPVVAALCVLFVDAADTAMAAPARAAVDVAVVRTTIMQVAGRMAVASTAAMLVLSAATVGGGGSTLLRAIGLVGAVVAAAGVVWLRRT